MSVKSTALRRGVFFNTQVACEQVNIDKGHPHKHKLHHQPRRITGVYFHISRATHNAGKNILLYVNHPPSNKSLPADPASKPFLTRKDYQINSTGFVTNKEAGVESRLSKILGTSIKDALAKKADA